MNPCSFCPACGFSFTQQPNHPYPPVPYGQQQYGQPGYPHKSTAIALILSFFFAGLGQLYVGKIKRGIAFILAFVLLSVLSSVLTLNIEYNDVEAIRGLLSNGAFIAIMLVSLGFWLYNMYDAYRQARKFNDASVRNDLARFLRQF